MTFRENTHLTSLAAKQEKRLVKSLGRIDIILFIVAAYISLDTIGSVAACADGASEIVKSEAASRPTTDFLMLIFLRPRDLFEYKTG